MLERLQELNDAHNFGLFHDFSYSRDWVLTSISNLDVSSSPLNLLADHLGQMYDDTGFVHALAKSRHDDFQYLHQVRE